jgi:hypothetical protein
MRRADRIACSDARSLLAMGAWGDSRILVYYPAFSIDSDIGGAKFVDRHGPIVLYFFRELQEFVIFWFARFPAECAIA